MRFRQLLLAGVLLLAAAPMDAAVQVSITKPQPSELSGDLLTVNASVTSTYQLQSVTATVADRSTSLTFDSSFGRWTCTLDLTGLPRGPLQLTVAAQDVFGSTDSEQVTFIHDRKPVITIVAPLSETVARPLIRITASCSDDDAAGCSSIRVRPGANDAVTLASGVSSIDQDVSLDAFEGQTLALVFVATDSAQQVTTALRFVHVDSSARLHEFQEVTGRIVDAQPDRILFLDQSGTFLKIRDIATAADTDLPATPGKKPGKSFLTPRGAIFSAFGATVVDSTVYEWQDGNLLTHTHPDSESSLEVTGAYAIWTGPRETDRTGPTYLFRRDILAGTTTEVPFVEVGNNSNDVDEDGTVAFWSSNPYNIHRYNGGLQQVTNSNGSLWYTYPLLDGSSTLYRKHSPCCGGQMWAIAHHDGTSETEISPFSSTEVAQDADYQIRNGWIAVTRPGTAGERQVWRLAPDDSSPPRAGSTFSVPTAS